jgi:hypothetical protein
LPPQLIFRRRSSTVVLFSAAAEDRGCISGDLLEIYRSGLLPMLDKHVDCCVIWQYKKRGTSQ